MFAEAGDLMIWSRLIFEVSGDPVVGRFGCGEFVPAGSQQPTRHCKQEGAAVCESATQPNLVRIPQQLGVDVKHLLGRAGFDGRAGAAGSDAAEKVDRAVEHDDAAIPAFEVGLRCLEPIAVAGVEHLDWGDPVVAGSYSCCNWPAPLTNPLQSPDLIAIVGTV